MTNNNYCYDTRRKSVRKLKLKNAWAAYNAKLSWDRTNRINGELWRLSMTRYYKCGTCGSWHTGQTNPKAKPDVDNLNNLLESPDKYGL